MAPTLVDRLCHRDEWIYEEKVDGWRMQAYKNGGAVKLVSRQARDHTARFPEIVMALKSLSDVSRILDGEMAIYDRRLNATEWDPEKTQSDSHFPRKVPTSIPTQFPCDGITRTRCANQNRRPSKGRRVDFDDCGPPQPPTHP